MSLLQLPEQADVAWARLLDGAGEGGSYAYQIDASGASTRNRMMYRPLMPNGGSPSMKTRLRLTSSLTVGNPAFEGIAVRHRGFKLGGGIPSTSDTEVWDSDPESKGTRAWYSEQSGTFTDAVFVEPVPDNLGIDYITFELIVRAASGQVTISSVECRNHYSTPYDLGIQGSQLWTSGLSNEIVAQGISGDGPVVRYFRYVKTVQTPIRKGQLVKNILKGAITGRAVEFKAGGADARRLAASVGIVIKMRRVNPNTTYDYFTLSAAPVSVDNKTVFADGSTEFRALHDYSQTEVLPFTEPTQISTADGYISSTVDRMGIEDIELDMFVIDYITASQ
ncbi:hypothetical protein [uncultured Paraglaciecola sp.]|uniref:hypothetical protein n=1 Tax=uncultured Paraglaciecola sp. TaxID=1765024 RepID=UPI00260E993D|nr:hypothetical protein [uncultured Paraglaciecola sp.]